MRLEALLQPPETADPAEPVAAFWTRHRSALGVGDVLAAAATAAEPAQAIGLALQAALRRLDLGLPDDQAACLCISEEGGGHPRAIASTLTPDGEGWWLDGAKAWSSGGVSAATLLVVARAGERDGRPDLRAVRVPGEAQGVVREAMPELGMLPGLEHARVRFDAVRVAADDVLEGDAFTRVVRPFRTMEDIYVGAGMVGWMLGALARAETAAVARRPWLALALGLPMLAVGAVEAPALHAALDAWQADLARVAGTSPALLPEDAARWTRDRAVLVIAGRARAARAARAWAALGIGAPSESSVRM